MSFDKLEKTIKMLAKYAEDNEQIPLSLFSIKLAKASEAYPEDHCIGMMSNIISKMNNTSDKIFITRAEIKDLYRRLYTRNTKFANVFAQELGNIEKVADITTLPQDNTTKDLIQEGFNQVVDPELSKDLNLAFGNDLNVVNNSLVSKAKAACEAALLGLEPQLNLEGQTDQALLFRASFNTPKGVTSVYVPVKYDNRFVDQPQVFQGNHGVELISAENITNYIVSHAGEKLQHEPQLVLNVVKEAFKVSGSITAVDIAMLRMKTASVPEVEAIPSGEVELPVYEDKEFNSFAEAFDNPQGVAEFRFGKNKVKLATSMVLKNLNNCGLYNAQIKISKSNDKEITYVVKANNVAFNVPVKIDENVQEPTYFVASGNVEPFTSDGVNKLLSLSVVDTKAMAVASPLYDVHPAKLVETVEQAINERNFKKAEDALNVLEEVHPNDTLAYKTAFEIYMNGLSETPQEKRSGCTNIVHNANHSTPVCGHLNLPLNKVFQDKHGTCRPLYRKDEEVATGGYLMTNKIFI